MIYKILEYLLRKNKIYYAYKFIKFLPKNYKDKKGNNLFHYCASLQHESIFDLALINNADINEKNNLNYIPIQYFVIYSFFKEDIVIKENDNSKTIKFNFFNSNIELLEKMINIGANLNYIMIKDENSNKVGVLNNLETPIEGLISGFWLGWNTDVDGYLENNYKEKLNVSLNNYYDTFNLLVNNGANINTIKEPDETLDTNTASWYTEDKHIVSLFFTKFIRNKKDLDIIKPLLLSDKIDFSLLDNTGNNIFHILFGRFSSRYEDMGYDNMVSFLNEVLNKETFNPNFLNVINDTGITPIECLKKDSKSLVKVIDSIILKNKLTKELNSPKIKRKIDKI